MKCRAVESRNDFSFLVLMLSSALMLFFQLPVRAGQSVTLAWNSSGATNLAGYKIYSGTVSHSYSSVMTVGNATTATLSGLVAGQTYYFAATMYDSAGNESAYSNEASYAVPLTPAMLTSASRSGGQFSFTVSGDAGQSYVVQASTNLASWVSLQTNTAPFVFTDPSAACFKQRFYRTYSLAP